MAKKQITGPRTYRVTLEGKSPMLHNKCDLITRRTGRPSPAEIAEMQANEWKTKAYFSSDIGVYMPSEHIERAIAVAAGNWKLGKKVTATVFCADTRIPIAMKNLPKFTSVEDFDKHGLVDRRNVKMQTKSTVARARPMIPTGWRATFELMVSTPEITKDTLEEILSHAGMYTGIGDYRPKFGRFDVASIEEVS